jgi:uncharacterized protein
MRIEGEYTFDGPREMVYELLQDPDALARAMPGATSLTQLSDDRYDCRMAVKVGPVSGAYSGTVTVKDARRPDHFVLEVSGRGAAGFLKGEGTVDLEDVPEGTLIRYAGETHVGGRIAQVGQRLIESVARKLINDGLQSLESDLHARQNPDDAGDAQQTEHTNGE